MPISNHRAKVWLLVIGLSAIATLTNQAWVGGRTIYADDLEAARTRLHNAILTNTLPPGVESWSSVGANSFNARQLVAWLVEGLHRLTGASVPRSYFVVETVSVFLCCLLLFVLIDRYAGPLFGLVALLYYASVLPLTYFLHYFHPWDKPSLATWIAAMYCVLRERWVLLGVSLTLGMVIKFDIVVFPLFVLLVEYRRHGWRQAWPRAAVFLALTVVLYVVLQRQFPGGTEPRPVVDIVVHNLRDFKSYALKYPPLLGLGVVAVMAALGYRAGDGFARAGVEVAAVVALILFIQTFFIEFRAEGPLLVLLLPAAVVSLRQQLGAPTERAAPFCQ